MTIILLSTLIGLTLHIVFSTYYVIVYKRVIKAQIPGEFSFVHISDIHGTINFINGKLRSIINSLKPDFVVITGDLSNYNKDLPRVLKELEKIETAAGIIIVPGNYENEEIIGFKKVERDVKYIDGLIKKTKNVILLKNQHHVINAKNSRVLIYGFDNSTYGSEAYYPAPDNLKFDYKIILAHSPSIINYIEKNNIECDQVLVGHTHGGQINIFNNFHLRGYKKYHIGMKRFRKGIFCISRGMGTVKIPFRFNCFPEVSFYRIIPK